jgi:two-component system, OmpR family, sensor histidine kinase KdpD
MDRPADSGSHETSSARGSNARPHVMACVGAGPFAARLVSEASSRAREQASAWVAAYVETPAHRDLPERERNGIEQALLLARYLGAETVRLSGDSVAGELIAYAREHGVTEILVGEARHSHLRGFLGSSIVHNLLRAGGGIQVSVVQTVDADPYASSKLPWRVSLPRTLLRYASGVAAVAISAVLAGIISTFVALPNLSLVFLTGVLYTAVRSGLGVSIFCSVLAVFAEDFFFVPPVHTLRIDRSADLLTLGMLLMSAILTSHLAARVRRNAEAARQREAMTAALYSLSRAVARSTGQDQLLQAICRRIAELLGVRVVVLLADSETGDFTVRYPPTMLGTLGAADMEAAVAAWEQQRPAGRDTDLQPTARYHHLPVGTANGQVGVFAIELDSNQGTMTASWRRLLNALLDQSAVAIERAVLSSRMERTQLEAEAERLRTTLLLSVSHDLRTPLASIIGSATSLLQANDRYTEDMKRELLTTVRDEALRLNQFVANLLDMAQLESGPLDTKREWVEIQDVVGAALSRTEAPLSDHVVKLSIDPALPMLRLDFVMMQQVLVNLLHNAAKYAPSGTPIELIASQDETSVRLEVADEGVGIPDADLERVFRKFFRLHQGDNGQAGAGLGLAICRGLVEAHGGRIFAESPGKHGKGATVTVVLPIEGEAPSIESENEL